VRHFSAGGAHLQRVSIARVLKRKPRIKWGCAPSRAFREGASSRDARSRPATVTTRRRTVEVWSALVIAQKAMTEEKAPSRGPALVKLDFLIGTKLGLQSREEARTGGGTSLSERRIKTLPLSPYSSKTWRKNQAKVLIPKDRGGVPPLPTSKRQTNKNTSSQATTRKFIFGRTDGEMRTASQISLRTDN
jgi:hypothetical protein